MASLFKASWMKKMTGELWLLVITFPLLFFFVFIPFLKVGANATCVGLASVYTWHTWISHPETTINKANNRYPYLIQRSDAKTSTNSHSH
jgi:hypothetical protein